MRLTFPINLQLTYSTPFAARERCIYSFFHETLPHAVNSRKASSNASLICSSFQLGPLSLSSALSRIRACCNLRAESFPVEIICSKSFLSSSVSFTIYVFMESSSWVSRSLFHQDIPFHLHLSNSQ